MVDRAWNAIDSYIYGFTLQELNFPIEATEYAKAAQEYLPHIPADKYPYMNRLTQHLIDGNYDGIADFNFGLELILDGLEQAQYKADGGETHFKICELDTCDLLKWTRL